jgi:REP element-mobilizing transposase RayT
MRDEPTKINLPPETLEKLLQTASACALALLLVNADQFAIQAGDLSQKGFNQMRQALHKYWPSSTRHDLNRFVGLYLDESFYYLFAKFLPNSDTLLCLAFTPKTPWVRIRQDMTDLMRYVLQMTRSQLGEDAGLEQSLQFTHKPFPASEKKSDPSLESAGGDLEDRKQRTKEEVAPKQIFPKPPDQPSERRSAPDGLMLDGPPSNQREVDSASIGDWVSLEHLFFSDQSSPARAKGSSKDRTDFEVLRFNPVEKPFGSELEDWRPLEEASQPESSDLAGLFHEGLDLQKRQTSSDVHSQPANKPEALRKDCPSLFSEEATQPHKFDEESEFKQIKISDITFYLVPRLDRHYLLGELAKRLRDWFPGICETYGWQLDSFSLRPDYIKWRLHDFPDALIHEMLEVVRKRTSERIFRVFPNMRDGNPTDDFWSPGYLVDGENQDFSTQVLIAHMAPKRQQGS